MPSAGQIMRARRRFAALLPDRATIERPTTVYDGAGGHTDTWANLATGVHCRLWTIGGGEDSAAAGDQLSGDATGLVTFAHGQDVTKADRIVIAGTSYEVLLVRGHGAWEMTTRVEVKES